MNGLGGRSGDIHRAASPVMTRLGRRSGAAAALLLSLLVATPASPAGAEEGGPAITIDSPRADRPLESPTVTVSGTATSGSLYRMRDITLTASGDAAKKVTCSQSPCAFSWTLTRPSNGRYEYKIAATQALPLVGTAGPSNERTGVFHVAAPAAKPVLDPPTVNEARNTELSWTRNTEPDMLYYAVFRKDPGGSKYMPVGNTVPQPGSGAKVPFTDTTTSAFNGGDYSYQVVAVRKGAGGDWPKEIASDPSSARTATVPAPPTTTSITGPGAPAPGAPPAAGPTTTVKPGTSAGVDLSGFLSSRSQPVTLPSITVPEPPDTGFEGTLPFGARPPGDDLEEGEAEAVLPDDARRSIISRIDPGRPLVPVAGGLVLLLLAMHLRLLNHRIKVAPDGDLPVDAAPVPPPPAAPAPAPVRAAAPTPPPARRPAPAAPPPQPAPAPASALYDVDDGWDDEDWAPEPAPAPARAREADPEPELVTLWAPPEADEPDPAPFDPDEVEVFEVVSSNRRRLARAGAP